MRTDSERLALMHKRARELKKQGEKNAVIRWGSACAVLVVLLAVFALRITGRSHGIVYGGFAASSLLSESAGGYVLAGVICFAAGVALTLLIQRYRKKDRKK